MNGSLAIVPALSSKKRFIHGKILISLKSGMNILLK